MNNPKFFGNYQIENSLGEDFYFEWYRAFDVIRKRLVLIKKLKQDKSRNREIAQLLITKAQLAGELVHPNLAWIWETGEIDGEPFLVERFVEGRTLRQILQQEEKIPLHKAQEIITQIARGLNFAHSHGFAHGIVKPENIVINPDLGAVLKDIGPSIALQAITSSWSTVIDLEIAPYIAPEVWKGNLPSAASDQYSLACILAEMLSSEKTFDASSINAIKEKHLSAFQAPLSWAVSIPWPTAKAILRALSHEPSHRFENTEAFSHAPQSIKEDININPKLQKEAEIQALAWQEAQQKARKESEEKSRLAALEKARQEMEEEIKQQTSDSQSVQKDIEDTHKVDEQEIIHVAAQPNDAEHPPAQNNRGWWTGLLGLLLVMIAVWFANSNLMSGDLKTMTPTLNTPITSDTPIPPASPTSTPTATFTVTGTATQTKISTPTKTPTFKKTNTTTPTITKTPTFTKTPKDEEGFLTDRQSISLLLWGNSS